MLIVGEDQVAYWAGPGQAAGLQGPAGSLENCKRSRMSNCQCGKYKFREITSLFPQDMIQDIYIYYIGI